MKTSSLPQSKSDSLFGMALAQAFMGMAFGTGIDHAWEAAETASVVYEDRRQQKPANDRNTYKLGEKKSLTGTFGLSMTGQTMAEMERATLRSFFKPAGYSFAM